MRREGREKPESGQTMRRSNYIRFTRTRTIDQMVPRRYMRTSISDRVEFSGDGGDKKNKYKMLIADLNNNFNGH